MRKLIGVIVLFGWCFIARAQEKMDVTIKVVNKSKEAIAGATILVLSVPDTLHKQQQIADSSGATVIPLEMNHPYLVRISSVDYQPLEKSISVKGSSREFVFTCTPSVKTLGNVVITASRPLMRQDDDKTIVDPENLAISSTNAYEIIEKTPGLFVDQDGNIYLSSTMPAKVYINGREQKMSAADMATLLKSLPPNAIASIEIMRTPSAKYDASGSGGIVNVVLRKGVKIGLTGSVNVGMNQGQYGNQFAGININYNNGKLTDYFNAQVSNRNSSEQIITNRLFATDSMLEQNANTVYPATGYYLGYGIGYDLTPKWELSYDVRFSYNSTATNSTNVSNIRKLSTNQLIASNNALVNNKGWNYNITEGISTKYKIDSAGSEWTIDLSHTYSPNVTNQNFSTEYVIPSFPTLVGDGYLNNKLNFFSAATNLVNKLPGKITIESGLKSTSVHFTNNNDYYHMSNGTRVKDSRTGAYNYNENINAAYLQGSKMFGSFLLKMGARLENTNMAGEQLVPKDTAFNLHRTDLFPYVYLSRSVMKIAQYDLRAYLVYRRTITRPAYEYLNPSPRYVDPYLYESGNPSLRPQFTTNYEANISVDERPLFAVGINDTKDIFTQVVYQADSNHRQSFRTYDNLGSNKEKYFRVLGAIPPGGRFFFVIGTQYNYNDYEGLYEGKPIDFKRGSWTFFTYQQLKITPNTQFSIHGYARFNGQLQFYELSPFGQLNMSLNQQFMKKKITVSLSAQDLFYTSANNFTINQGSLHASGVRKSDTQRFGLNLRYNFGIRKKEENRFPDMDVPDKKP
jgi:iron complex outermembrane recepter protein